MDLWTYEREQWNQGFDTICGVDEAGAGPLAGPVYAAAVILPRELDISGLNDSKKLTEKKREALFDIITARAVSYSIQRVEAAEIDEIDILNARMKAMQLAIDGLSVRPDMALIDGNRDHGSRFAVTAPHVTIVGGDGKSASIAAASILAKVSRDRYVSTELNAQYPQYQFAKHKGYGTKLHYEMLDQYGPCPAHRVTFLKKWEARKPGADEKPPGTGARRRWPATCGRRATPSWPASGAAGSESWTWWPGINGARSALWRSSCGARGPLACRESLWTTGSRKGCGLPLQRI